MVKDVLSAAFTCLQCDFSSCRSSYTTDWQQVANQYTTLLVGIMKTL